jgi:TonB-linked SusC/RagA family outer membrane protein
MKNNFTHDLFLTKKRILKIIMRSFILLFCGVAFGFSPKFSFSQNAKIIIESDVTLSVEQVFELIQKQTDYNFIYGEDIFTTAPKVKLKKGVIKASKLLELTLTSGNFVYEFTSDKTIILSRKKETSAIVVNQTLQTKVITGKVTNGNDPLPGVTVLVKGTGKGTTTDFDGIYTISAKKGDVLEFTFLGMQSKSITVGDDDQINVKMEENTTSLDEIVLTGVAGKTDRKKLTISVTKISEDQFNNAPATNIGQALVGKVAGARVLSSGSPGSASQIQLRSDTNLGVGSSPLIIMDGVIINTSLADINADDIESVEVVKGAAASALYGSRAGNGVISITSKRGNRLATGNSNLVVRNEIGFQNITKYIDLAESHPYKLMPGGSNQGTFTAYDGVTFPPGYVGGYSPLIVGSRTVDDDHYLDNPYGVTRNHQKEYFQTGETMTNFVSYSSNTAKTNVYGSFENNKQTGVVPFTDGYGRQNYRINIDHQIAPWLKLSTSNLFTDSKNQNSGAGFIEILLAEPDNDLGMANPVDGQPYYLRHNHWSDFPNPLYSASKIEIKNKNTSFINNIKVNARLNSWANLDLSHSLEIQNYDYSYYAPYDTWTLGSGGDNDLGLVYSEGTLIKRSTNSNQKQTQVTLNLSKKFKDLTVKGKISVLNESNESSYTSVGSNDFTIRDLPTFDAFTVIQNASSENTKELARNYFVIASLDYKDRYLADLMFRRDGSSLFGEDSKWSNYYRASGAYRITQDIAIPGVQELKIRAAVGTAGIRPGFNWQYETYALNAGVSSPGQKGNKLLKPSQTKEIEFGLDVAFLNKFTFQANYAKSITTDQFLSVPLISFVNDGFTSQYQNAGTVEGNTLELSFGANWYNKNDFKWSSNLVFTKSNQKITELPIAPYQSGPDNLFYIKEGETYGAIYGYTWVTSLDQMSAQLPVGKTINDYEVNSDGYVVSAGSQGTVLEKPIKLQEDGSDALVKIGDGLPDFMFGLSNTINYKGFTFYFLFDVKSGGDIYNRKAVGLASLNRNGFMDMSNIPEGSKKTIDYYQGFYDASSNNSYWVEDGSFVKLRELSVGYTLNSSQLPFSSLNMFKSITGKIVGRNLLTFTKYSGHDPEVGSIRAPFDAPNAYPNFRNIALSLTFEF